MADFFYLVSVSWTSVPTPPLLEKATTIEAVLGHEEDWLRLNALTWIVRSKKARARDLYSALVSRITTTDRLLVVRLDVSDLFGWQEPWVWQWFSRRHHPVMPPPTPRSAPPRSG